MPEFVRIPIHGELMERSIRYENFAEDAGPGTDDTVIKEVRKGKNGLNAVINFLKITLKPNLERWKI